MKDIKYCILGDGLLGSELRKQTQWDVISRKIHGFDIRKPKTWNQWLFEKYHGVIFVKKYDVLINCIGHTDTYSFNRKLHWKVNYEGVVRLADFCKKHKIKLVHISSDYVYSKSVSNASEEDVPVHCATWYGYTKLLGDAYVQLKSSENLIIRCTHKPNPFPYKMAWAEQVGNFDYVDKIGRLIVELIENEADGVYNVGTNKKNMYELAVQTNPDVEPISIFPHKETPSDITMNIEKLEQNRKWLHV